MKISMVVVFALGCLTCFLFKMDITNTDSNFTLPPDIKVESELEPNPESEPEPDPKLDKLLRKPISKNRRTRSGSIGGITRITRKDSERHEYILQFYVKALPNLIKEGRKSEVYNISVILRTIDTDILKKYRKKLTQFKNDIDSKDTPNTFKNFKRIIYD